MQTKSMEHEENGKQIALWAYSLTIHHPISSEEMTFYSIPEQIGTWKIIEDIELDK